VIGVVLLDIYRNKRASEVRVLSKADRFRTAELAKIARIRTEISGLSRSESKGKSLRVRV